MGIEGGGKLKLQLTKLKTLYCDLTWFLMDTLVLPCKRKTCFIPHNNSKNSYLIHAIKCTVSSTATQAVLYSISFQKTLLLPFLTVSTKLLGLIILKENRIVTPYTRV